MEPQFNKIPENPIPTLIEVNKKEAEEEKRPFKVTDRFRLFRKGIMAANLEDLILKGKSFMITIWYEMPTIPKF